MGSPPETAGLELGWSQIQGISELTFGTSLEDLPEDLLQKGWDTSGSTAKAEVCGLMTWHIGEYDSSQAPWCMILVARPKLNRAVALSTRHGAVSRSVAGITVDESATWAWVGLYKMSSWIFDFTGFSRRLTWIPKFQQQNFCLWMADKILLLRGDISKGIPFLASYWHHS